MRRTILIVMTILVAGFCSMPSIAHGISGDNSGAMKFTRVGVNDPGINNIEAVSFLIPAGWKTDGGVQWFPDYSILANLLMRITDPQTGAQIEFLPLQNFTWMQQTAVPMQQGTNYMGNIFWQPITELPTFVQTFFVPQTLRHLQQARVVSVKDQPKIAQIVQQQWGAGAQAKSQCIRYEYQINGQAWQEDVYLTTVYSTNSGITIWSDTSAYSFRAPAGKLDELTPTMATTINTMRLSPDWYAGYMYVQQLFMNRQRQGIANAKAISDTVTRNSEEIRKMFADSYRQSQESRERISQNWSEYIRGVDTYKNPFEDRPVQLPSGYNDAWVNSKGEYILSNEAGFNPNVGDTSDWRRMDRRGEQRN